MAASRYEDHVVTLLQKMKGRIRICFPETRRKKYM
jgi:hypothetical protein